MKRQIIEDFINENQREFDSEIPDKSIWLAIEKELDNSPKGRVMKFTVFKLAATLVTFICVGILIGLQLTYPKKIDFAQHDEYRKMLEIERHYNQQVSFQLEKIDNPETTHTVEKDLMELDIIYQELKNELLKNDYANSQMLIEAMIKNHKTKTDILEKILLKQNQIVQYESL